MSTTKFTSVADTTVVSKIARSNTKRKELIITNSSASTLYLAFGRLPSSTNYAVKLLPNDVLITENPEDVIGVWDADSTGQANVSEESND